METSSKPESASIDIETQDVHPSSRNGDSSVIESSGEPGSGSSIRETHIDPAAEASFLKRMDYRMVPLLFMLCKMTCYLKIRDITDV